MSLPEYKAYMAKVQPTLLKIDYLPGAGKKDPGSFVESFEYDGEKKRLHIMVKLPRSPRGKFFVRIWVVDERPIAPSPPSAGAQATAAGAGVVLDDQRSVPTELLFSGSDGRAPAGAASWGSRS